MPIVNYRHSALWLYDVFSTKSKTLAKVKFVADISKMSKDNKVIWIPKKTSRRDRREVCQQTG